MRNAIYIFIIMNYFSAVFAQMPQDREFELRIKELEKMKQGSVRVQTCFELAQECFNKGKYDIAEKLLNEFISTATESKKNSKYRLKALAMLEYLMRYGPKSIEKTLKEARKLQNNKQAIKKKLNTCLVLIGRARDWKERSVSQWNELAGMLLKVLESLSDSGQSVTASQIALLKVKIYELQGNYQQGIQILRECIKQYYPRLLGRFFRFPRRNMAPRRLLAALGKLYAGQAGQVRQKAEKRKLYSKATGYFIKSVKGLHSSHIEVANVRSDVIQCQEALRLLGYKLRLPRNLQTSKKDVVFLLEQMLKQKRYKAAQKAIELQLKKHKKESEICLLRLYARSLAGNKNYVKSLDTFQKAAQLNPVDKKLREDILSSANLFQKLGQDNIARELFALFVKIAPEHPDFEQALFQCANISMHLKNYEAASKYFKICASKTDDIKFRAKALFNAAQSEYQLKNYLKVLAIIRKTKEFEKSLSPVLLRDFTLLKAQSLLKLAQSTTDPENIKYSSQALTGFEKLLELDNLPPEIKQKIILMASFSAITARKPETAMELLKNYLKYNISEPNALQIASRLLELYFKHKEYDAIEKLSQDFMANYPDAKVKREFVFGVGKRLIKLSLPQKSLGIFSNFIQSRKYDEKFLLRISKVLLSDDFSKYRSRADKLLTDIFSVNLPLAPSNPLAGEVYSQLANAYFRLQDNKASLNLLDKMLAQKKVYCYFEVKTLRAKIQHSQKQYSSAIKDCQEMLLANPPQDIRKEVIYYLADSYRCSGNEKKAIATAWTIVPLTPKKFTEEEKTKVKKTLLLIYSCAKKINSQADKKESAEIYKSLFPNGILIKSHSN